MKNLILTILCICVILGGFQNILADQIVLKNGDRITGKIIKKETDKITIETDFAGTITILASNIDKVIEETKTSDLIQTKAEVIAEKTENIVTEKVEVKDEKSNTSSFSNSKKRSFGLTSGWDGAANIGFSFTRGNSKTSTIVAGIRAEKSGDNDKWTTYLNGLYNRNRAGGLNVTTSNAIWGGLRYDRNLTKKWFAFGSYDFERDKPQRLNFRSVLGGGLGYHFIKNERTELDLFSGAAWNRTWFLDAANTSSAEVLFGNSLKHQFNDRVKIQQGFIVYPNLTSSGDYRFVFDSTLTADLTKKIGWFVTVADRFNSAPLFGVEKNDFLFTTGLKWSFGKTK
ncbi:MAG TPA: DUF481 domain-containing protein [Pyrinomonadaceae bacterium]|nr:DUF481 domain-containing protein [Pyrinomonadaceae bacterium]